MEHIVEGNGIPHDLCGIYHAKVTGVTIEGNKYVVDMEAEGYSITKKFAVGSFLYHFIKNIGLDPEKSTKASDMVGRELWLAIALDAQRDESFIFNFYVYTDEGSRPGIAGDPILSETGEPSGQFIRHTDKLELR